MAKSTDAPGGERTEALVRLTRDSIDLPALLDAAQTERDGAVTSFLGVVRNHAEGRKVMRLEYFAYEPMALARLQEIGREIATRWDARLAIVHRLGLLEIGEASVAIVVACPHRADAFEACRYAIEAIKKDAPIWKKEFFEDGAVWVEGPSPGETADGNTPGNTPGIISENTAGDTSR